MCRLRSAARGLLAKERLDAHRASHLEAPREATGIQAQLCANQEQLEDARMTVARLEAETAGSTAVRACKLGCACAAQLCVVSDRGIRDFHALQGTKQCRSLVDIKGTGACIHNYGLRCSKQ